MAERASRSGRPGRRAAGLLLAAAALATAACGGGASAPPAPASAQGAGGSASSAPAAAPVVQVRQSGALGPVLADSQGMTLYLYTQDGPDQSNCTGGCAALWPPLTVPPGTTPTGTVDVTGKLGTITRPDGSRQVTINGHPLYRYVQDHRPGDTAGQGVGGRWYAVTPAGEPVGGGQAQAGATVRVATDPRLGPILVDAAGRTLYLYTKDTPGTSTCTGPCATLWPPLTVPAGSEPQAGPGVSGTLGVIARPDGTRQVTINGQPLYRYSGDQGPGDVRGQGVGNVWFVVKPSGAQNATPLPAPASSAAGY
jgi:predicted lipoprotein with Yx(FWY)xxD motif